MGGEPRLRVAGDGVVALADPGRDGSRVPLPWAGQEPPFGFSPPAATAEQATGQRFPVKYYLTAMLFIVFDIEIVFLYPWAVSFDKLGVFALVEMVLFMLTVFVAYTYVWRRGGLSWD